MPLSVGFGLVTGQVPWRGTGSVADEYADTLALARLAEQLGFDAIWASEHHFAEDAYLPSVLVLLAGIAAVTERVRLGTAVALAPFHNPLRFAEDAAVLDQLSRGRLMIGLGAAWRTAEFAAFGLPVSERVSRTVELARVCRLAWDNACFSFSGKHWKFTNVSVTPRPYGKLPLLLGGSVPAAAARAGRLAQGFLATGTPGIGVAGLQSQVAVFDEAARSAGKDPDQMTIGFHVNAWVSKDGSLADDALQAMWNQVGRYQLWHAQDAGSSAVELPPLDEAEIRRRALFGTPGQVVAAAQPWLGAFGQRDLHVIFRLHYPGMPASVAADAMRLFAAEVIPQLKDLSAPIP
jgi:alkanesulfonate monooxygenase SsuD/methylene tetrahydromethanopterin reductase-like flavin-dependent oxidoreductase (luciferase family)